MEPLKDAYADTKIKEETLTSNEYNDLPGNSLPEEAATSCKDASEEREFTVILDGMNGMKHVVRGRLCDSVLTALRATEYVCAWVDRKGMEEFYLIEKKKRYNICINLGMPLKYVPEGSQFEMKRYKLKKDEKTNELWYRQYDRKEECVLFYVYGNSSRMQTHGAQSRRIIRCSKVLGEYCRFCIFAPEGDSVRDAVCNDGRFLPMLKEKDWVLIEGAESRHNSSSVKNLSGKHFEIHVMTERGAKCSGGPNEKQNRSASSKGQLNAFEKQQQQHHHHHPPEQGQLSIFKKKQRQEYFEQHLLDLYPKLKEQGEIIDKFLEVYKRDFSKEINDSLSIKFLRTLDSYSHSVGYIHWSSIVSEGCATCFVLSGRYFCSL